MSGKFSLRAKLLTAGIALSVLPVMILAFVVYFKGQDMKQHASRECEKLAYADLDHIAEGAYAMVESQQEVLSKKVAYDLNVARKVLQVQGKVSFDNLNKVRWSALNQFTKRTVDIDLPRMLVGGKWLGKNKSFEKKTLVVDEAQELVGGTCTIFQRMNEHGDMLRVATNVKKLDGNRAIGTYIPRTNPDGSPNKVINTVLRGETFRGRAFVVNAWYITAYEPMRDDSGKIVGILYTGVKEESAESLRKAIMATLVGKTGYIFVIDSKGKYVISKDGKRDGEDISGAKDANGVLFIQEIAKKAKKLGPKDIAEQKYPWKNKDDKEARMKVARLKYFKKWDWIIGASSYEDEFKDAVKVIEKSTAQSSWWIGLISLLALFSSVGLWGFISSNLSSEIGNVAERLGSSGREVSSASKQVANSSQNLAASASEQASSLEEISSSMEEMTAMTRQSSDNAREANGAMSEAKEAADSGAAGMERMNVAIAKIKQSSDETAKIVKTIDEIAFQTNLLALNAAVEAARAGEAGKGFAVVAEEVRNLAQRCAEAARTTSQLIEGSQKNAEEGVGMSGEVVELLGSISSTVQRAANIVGEVATACDEQARGIVQINEAIAQMDRVTQSNAADSEESAAASQELSAQSKMLMTMVGKLEDIVGGQNKSEPVFQHESKHELQSASFSQAVAAPQAPMPRAIKAPPAAILPLSEDEIQLPADW